MSVNRYRLHVFILPEDDANRQLATGFLLGVATAQIRVLTEVGGWAHVRDRFNSDHVADMRRFPCRLMVLLIDFDGAVGRLDSVRNTIPNDLRDRVFVLGSRTEPEALRIAGLGTYETIGQALAMECRNGIEQMWGHDLLQNNRDELARLRPAIQGILMDP